MSYIFSTFTCMKDKTSYRSGLGGVLFWSVISAAFIGPGTVTTAAAAGAGHGLTLLWALVFSTLACIVLQEAGGKNAFTFRVNTLWENGSGFEHLDAPVERLSPPNQPVPFSPTLEDAFLPGVPDIVAAVDRLAAW